MGITGLVPGVTVWTKQKIGACALPSPRPPYPCSIYHLSSHLFRGVGETHVFFPRKSNLRFGFSEIIFSPVRPLDRASSRPPHSSAPPPLPPRFAPQTTCRATNAAPSARSSTRPASSPRARRASQFPSPL
jgi:hypothetical protein